MAGRAVRSCLSNAQLLIIGQGAIDKFLECRGLGAVGLRPFVHIAQEMLLFLQLFTDFSLYSPTEPASLKTLSLSASQPTLNCS